MPGRYIIPAPADDGDGADGAPGPSCGPMLRSRWVFLVPPPQRGRDIVRTVRMLIRPASDGLQIADEAHGRRTDGSIGPCWTRTRTIAYGLISMRTRTGSVADATTIGFLSC
jgi:hypothetical protein